MPVSISQKLKINNSLLREVLAEFLGTFVLIVFGDGSVAQFKLSKGTAGSPVSVYWSWGIGVMMGIYVAGGVSGGHINPSVTVAQACLGRCPWYKVPAYIVAQYCGSFMASVFVYLIYFDAMNDFDQGIRSVDGSLGTAGIFSTYPQPFLSVYNGLGDQVFGTAILLICVLAITDENNMKPIKGLIPISIGFVVFAIGMTYGFNCGYAINPARDLAPRIFTAIAGWGETPFNYREYKWFWIPVLGPHLGAIIGAFIYQLCVGLHWPRSYEITPPQSEMVVQNGGSSNEGYVLEIKES